jgi:hypothetical protein
MDDVKTNLAKRLKDANNVLVTVSRNPSLDQLAALLGLGLFLNKEGKHCAAVFSGNIPSALEFLKPETTIQKNTDSLRDFIIALDKSKADKLRYKVEDNIVRIFITPYKSSIGQDDLEFSQGDFNVDVVVALGVAEQADLDDSITAHGRILHDAAVASINVQANAQLGSINWNAPDASSLSELVTELIQSINPKAIDEQISTALLTGIVATTDRFSNEKTSAKTMSVSAELMAAGANQQLVANKLDESEKAAPTDEVSEKSDDDNQEASPAASPPEPPKEDGALEIEHDQDETLPPEEPEQSMELPPPEEPAPSPVIEPIITPPQLPDVDNTPPAGLSGGPKLVTEPPTLGGTLTANSTMQDDIEPSTDPLSMPQAELPQLLDHSNPGSQSSDTSEAPSAPSNTPLTPPPSDWMAPPPTSQPPVPLDQPAILPPPADSQQIHITEDGTLSQLEEAVSSPHIDANAAADTAAVTNAAREEVNRALSATDNIDTAPPIEALNAQPLGPELHEQNPIVASSPQPNLGGVPGFDPGQAQPPPPVPPPFNPGAPV